MSDKVGSTGFSKQLGPVFAVFCALGIGRRCYLRSGTALSVTLTIANGCLDVCRGEAVFLFRVTLLFACGRGVSWWDWMRYAGGAPQQLRLRLTIGGQQLVAQEEVSTEQ